MSRGQSGGGINVVGSGSTSSQRGAAVHGSQSCSASRALSLEYKGLQEEPLEGFLVKLSNEENLFEWQVAIFGPPDTLYQGGYFKAQMRFPQDYPYSPPTIKFLTKVWHPNIYENGDICISILHPPIEDPQSGELPSERWNPTQTVRTILLSVISMLNEPNTSSPANVDASVMYRRWKEGLDKDYEKVIRDQVSLSREEAEKDGVKIPTTVDDYCIKPPNPSRVSSPDLLADFLAEDYDVEEDSTEEDLSSPPTSCSTTNALTKSSKSVRK